jgi:DNA ligase D-like protein (predicted 3'-phosphoesterase)
LGFETRIRWCFKSWALPKIPPSRKGIKRLAIQVEDHPKSYANFEGEIIEGYGKGKVKIWDKGNFSLIKRTPKEIEFELQGKQLKGKYVLVNAKLSDDKKNWLFIKLN